VKKSCAVSIPLLSTLAAAALASGCGSSRQPAEETKGWQTCVERGQGIAVDQKYCDDELARPSTPGYVPLYGWYYFPRGYYWNGPAIGSRVPQGGSYGARPFTAAPMSRTGAVVRAGLGGTAAGSTAGASSGS
jgi:hypothetical protein